MRQGSEFKMTRGRGQNSEFRARQNIQSMYRIVYHSQIGAIYTNLHQSTPIYTNLHQSTRLGVSQSFESRSLRLRSEHPMLTHKVMLVRGLGVKTASCSSRSRAPIYYKFSPPVHTRTRRRNTAQDVCDMRSPPKDGAGAGVQRVQRGAEGGGGGARVGHAPSFARIPTARNR